MEKLIEFWESCYKIAKETNDIGFWNTCRHQAYGAAVMFMKMEPDAAALVEGLWNKNWSPAFIRGAMASGKKNI